MLWMSITRTLEDVRRIRPEAVLPGDEEPAWLRRAAEHERELPLLRAERRAQRESDEKPGLFERLWLVVSRG